MSRVVRSAAAIAAASLLGATTAGAAPTAARSHAPGDAWRATLVRPLAGVPAPRGAAARARATRPGAPTGRLLVLLRGESRGSGARSAATRRLLARVGARRAGPVVPALGLVTVVPAPGRTVAGTARALRRDRAVRAVQVERRFAPRLAPPNDPALSRSDPAAGAKISFQWPLSDQRFPAAWSLVPAGRPALVAVIDSGVDASHPELAGKIDGLIDRDDQVGDGPASVDETGHGTHVASLACAATNDGLGIAGAGYDCRLLVIKSDLSDASIAASIVDATNRGADAINMSFGDDGVQAPARAVVEAIDFAYARGVVLVAAAADSPVEEQGSPANILQPAGSGADIAQGRGLTVTAATIGGERARFAGRGTEISLAAYGSFSDSSGPIGLLGAFPAVPTRLEVGSPGNPACGCRTTFDGDSRYAYLQGTSMAAPMVAALGAMVRRLNPDLPVRDVLRLIKQSASRASGASWSGELGWGIIDAGATMDRARTLDRTPPTSRLRAPHRSGRSVLLRWSGSDPAAPGLVASGLRQFRVYASIDGGRARLLGTTTRRSRRFEGSTSTRYTFYTRAVDRQGNVESPPPKPDATTRIVR